MSSGYCSRAIGATPTGTARSSRSPRRASSRPITTRRASRSPWRCCRGSSGRWRTRTWDSSSPTRWTSGAISRSACRISGRCRASTPTGPRCTSARSSFPKTSTRAIPGSSRTSGCCGNRLQSFVLDGDDHVGALAAGRGHRYLLVESLPEQRLTQGRVHADIAGRHVELVRTHDPVAHARAVLRLEQHPGAEEHARRIARGLIDHHHSIETPPQVAHPPVDLAQPALAIGVFGILRPVALSGRGGDRGRDARPLVAPQLIEFRTQTVCPLRGDVLRARRGRRRGWPRHSRNCCDLYRGPFYRIQAFCGITHGRGSLDATNLFTVATKYYTHFVTGTGKARSASGSEWSGVVELRQPLTQGRANRELRSLLAESFDLETDEIRILHWARLH